MEVQGACILALVVEYSPPYLFLRGLMRHIPCKLLLAFTALLFTLPAFAAERGIKHVEIKTSGGETGLYKQSHVLVIGGSNSQDPISRPVIGTHCFSDW